MVGEGRSLEQDLSSVMNGAGTFSHISSFEYAHETRQWMAKQLKQ